MLPSIRKVLHGLLTLVNSCFENLPHAARSGAYGWPTEEHRAQCQTKLNILLEQQKDLSAAIDQLLADIEAGRKVYESI